tara:strand:- start:101 stop:301 length:201 start_codon:yes stop_codon:yes gene_type:complete
VSISAWLFAVGGVLIISTFKRPTWLGGPERRYMSEDSANAIIGRASRRSLAGYLILGGGLFWLVGL